MKRLFMLRNIGRRVMMTVEPMERLLPVEGWRLQGGFE